MKMLRIRHCQIFLFIYHRVNLQKKIFFLKNVVGLQEKGEFLPDPSVNFLKWFYTWIRFRTTRIIFIEIFIRTQIVKTVTPVVKIIFFFSHRSFRFLLLLSSAFVSPTGNGKRVALNRTGQRKPDVFTFLNELKNLLLWIRGNYYRHRCFQFLSHIKTFSSSSPLFPFPPPQFVLPNLQPNIRSIPKHFQTKFYFSFFQ